MTQVYVLWERGEPYHGPAPMRTHVVGSEATARRVIEQGAADRAGRFPSLHVDTTWSDIDGDPDPKGRYYGDYHFQVVEVQP